MCGIVAVMRRGIDRPAPLAPAVLASAEEAREITASAPTDLTALPAALDRAAALLAEIDEDLRGAPGLRFLIEASETAPALDKIIGGIEDEVAVIEAAFDRAAATLPDSTPGAEMESVNAGLIRLKDLCWAIRHDRLQTAAEVASLAGPSASPAAIEAYAAIETALSALDRLELRGRDSSGLHVLVDGHGLDLDDPATAGMLAARGADRLFTSGSVRHPLGLLAFVYKAASEIGRLGDNGRALRSAIAADDLLRMSLQAAGVTVMVLGHTRWASVGLINEANAHPLNHEEQRAERRDAPYVVGALNGDVDNYRDLVERYSLSIADEITTDAKVIPALVSRRLDTGSTLEEAFRATVSEFDGSVAIGAAAAQSPTRLMLAMRGSGQALYVGVSPGQFVVASEPYGVVEECPRALRMDGESTVDGGGHRVPPGQIVILDATLAGQEAGITRMSYDGSPLPVAAGEFRTAEITTRDIDLRGYPHFLRKEIEESPVSLRKTLRGRVKQVDGHLSVKLPPETLPPRVAERLADGSIRHVVVIGQGTAAIAGLGVAAALSEALAPTGLSVRALPATELSGFEMTSDMADVLAVAVSQSGTTTDTNRTVDLIRSRGAAVIAIVNRRGSDLSHKADGVFYTSDGRDVEMSVASTKAFYAQVAAGQLLGLALADAAGCGNPARAHELLSGLVALPEAMAQVLVQEAHIAELAARHAARRRSWAVVGNGRNLIAAHEVRIKLSELCYKAVACDTTEDKKHIDLSSEPLTLVCAAGLTGSAADDVVKEIGIFRAHKGAPVVIVTEGEGRFGPAEDLIQVPPAHPSLAYVLSAMAGHLFGYHAALAIDGHALPLRRARAALDRSVASESADQLLASLSSELFPIAADFQDRLRQGHYNGSLEAATAGRIVMALQAVTGAGSWTAGHGRLAEVDDSPSALLNELAAALTTGIDELTRPVDAIKHQAKTVTVGISRSDEALLILPLVSGLLATGAERRHLPYAVLRSVAALDPAVGEVTGYTRYRIDGRPDDPAASISVVDKGGVAAGVASRTERDHRLRGTKQLVALERQPLAAIGRSDGRSVLIVPEMAGGLTVGLTLLHVRFQDRLTAAQARQVLDGYRGRLAALRSIVTETEAVFDETRLASIPTANLLTDTLVVLAEHWRSHPA
jgi:glucosamine--fructose-6-phosphate aminotransferase (isomerizing)